MIKQLWLKFQNNIFNSAESERNCAIFFLNKPESLGNRIELSHRGSIEMT